MENDLSVKKVSEKKIARTKKIIAGSLGFLGILLILSQAVPLFRSYVAGKIELAKQSLMKDPLPESYKEYIQDEFAYYDPGKSYFANLSARVGHLEFQ